MAASEVGPSSRAKQSGSAWFALPEACGPGVLAPVAAQAFCYFPTILVEHTPMQP